MPLFCLHDSLISVFLGGAGAYVAQDGTRDTDNCNAVASDADGSIIVAGYTTGNWGTINEGGFDFFALALDADGEVLWTYQVSTLENSSNGSVGYNTCVFNRWCH